MTTRQVKFGINDYLGARTALHGTKWSLMLYHGTNCVDVRKEKYSTEQGARAAARIWIAAKLARLRPEYKQAELNVIRDAVERGYHLESSIHA